MTKSFSFESLIEELYEENWDVWEAVADLREMTDEHIRIIVQTSQKDGIENQHAKKVDYICVLYKIHKCCRLDLQEEEEEEYATEMLGSDGCPTKSAQPHWLGEVNTSLQQEIPFKYEYDCYRYKSQRRYRKKRENEYDLLH